MPTGSVTVRNACRAAHGRADRRRHRSGTIRLSPADELANNRLEVASHNTLSNNAGQRSPASATVRELRKRDLGEHR
jgi:hypothetical protein